MATLQMGAQGPAVSTLQAELNKAQGPTGDIPVDGDFGPATRAAVERFQRDHGLTADGVVGPETSAALAAATKAKPPKAKPPAPPPEDTGGAAVGSGKTGSGKTSGGKAGAAPVEVTLHQLHQIMPDLTTARGNLYIDPMNRAMAEFSITTYLRKAAFVAQIAEESIDLMYFEEIASGWEYDISVNRSLALELGNTQVGDGPRYKGRGPIQLTGRSNYIAAGKALGLDLVDHPDVAAQPNVGFRTAGWYWVSHGLNPLADARNFEEITLRINGGLNGYSVRLANYELALRVLG
jgi:putative chitinase